MNDITLLLRIIGCSFSIRRIVPDKIESLTQSQFLSIIRYLSGMLTDRQIISRMFNLSGFASYFVAKNKYYAYKLIESLESISDFSKPCSKFIITHIQKTGMVCDSVKFKGISFMQFMFADTMYTQYLKTQNEDHLLSFVASLYLRKGESFSDLDLMKRIDYLKNRKIEKVVYEAILINYMMQKAWLSVAYPYMFSSSETQGASSEKTQQGWLDIFDAFVGENIHNTDYYKGMPCSDAFRLINKRLKNHAHGK